MSANHSFWTRLSVVALTAALLVVACNNPSATKTPAAGGSGPSVAISNFAFDPATLTVKPGTTVTWTNNDSATHTVTADDGSWDSGGIAQGQTFTHTFNAAGTFSYHCSVHPSMKGTIKVAP